jgi:hypothetical protein
VRAIAEAPASEVSGVVGVGDLEGRRMLRFHGYRASVSSVSTNSEVDV